ncbi:MAG TPA: Uma2 family endonuclease [Chthonomonadaceae bacterium]|nr:Uma2 family endonuclease [Chthonomonadaceae bacterium]
MAQTLTQSLDEEADTGVRKHAWTVDEVYRAMAAGVFGSSPVDWLKMELIEGELIEKMPQNRPHSIALSLSATEFARVFASNHYVAQQVPLFVDDTNDPEPDVMVVAGNPRDYATDHPTGKDVRLVLEVSDTTLRQDRQTKSRLYARAGVQDYWILILKTRRLEVRRNPAPSPENERVWEYQTVQVFTEEDAVTPLLAPDASIRVADILPNVG